MLLQDRYLCQEELIHITIDFSIPNLYFSSTQVRYVVRTQRIRTVDTSIRLFVFNILPAQRALHSINKNTYSPTVTESIYICISNQIVMFYDKKLQATISYNCAVISGESVGPPPARPRVLPKCIKFIDILLIIRCWFVSQSRRRNGVLTLIDTHK